MRNIVLTYCIFHNYFAVVDDDQPLVDEVDWMLMERKHQLILLPSSRENDYRPGKNLKDIIYRKIIEAINCVLRCSPNYKLLL